MKTTTTAIVLGLLLSLSATDGDKRLYQVITSHAHELEELAPYIETVHEAGRLRIVDLKDGAPEELMAHLRPISGRERSFLYKRTGTQKKSLTVANVDIKDVLRDIDADNIKKDVEHLASFSTRAAGTPENHQASTDVEARFREMGYRVTKMCFEEKICNVIAEIPGAEIPQEVLLALGHIDSVGHDFAGADDNASGTAVLLEMARVLRDKGLRRTLRFLVTNSEELHLVGARKYIQQLQASNTLNQIKLSINMDMVGYNSNGIVELETNPNLEHLAKWMAELAAQYTSLKTKITLGAWGSDHVPLLDAGVSSILTIEDWSTKTPCYHTACDLPSTLNYDYAAEIARLNVSALLTKDLD
jgi:hypothetical protein